MGLGEWDLTGRVRPTAGRLRARPCGVAQAEAMIEYHRQASLEEKLNTTDLAITKKPTKPKQP